MLTPTTQKNSSEMTPEVPTSPLGVTTVAAASTTGIIAVPITGTTEKAGTGAATIAAPTTGTILM